MDNDAFHTFDNINVSREYDARYASDDVHYETFARLAAFFGRDMHPHWHDRYFQLHYLATGRITMQLDCRFYVVKAPLFVLTPPSVPHAFFTGPESDGHVLTVRQELVWSLVETLWPASAELVNTRGFCQSLESSSSTLAALDHYWPLVASEFHQQNHGRELLLNAMTQAIFTLLLRVALPDDSAVCNVRGEMNLFQNFNRLVDENFHRHLTVAEYARRLNVSESRLSEMCRRFSNQSPKQIVLERVSREARRLLRFSSRSVNQIALTLGYKDPAYFARFFHRMEGCSPSQYRGR